MPAFDLDIGVIYTHERELMPRLLETMSASGRRLRMRLILVDNASAEDMEPWCAYFPETRLLSNVRRLGYAANLNRILEASTARYTLLINTDMYFDPRVQCLGRMVAFMDGQPQCGLAGCRLYRADGAEAHAARRFPTLPLVLARRCGLGRLLRRAIERHFYAEHAPQETWPCDWLSGCFLMVRREAMAEVGGFDEGYGKYFEDVDICLRMARSGWQVMYHGATSCYHLEQRASKSLVTADAWRHLWAYVQLAPQMGLSPIGRCFRGRPAPCGRLTDAAAADKKGVCGSDFPSTANGSFMALITLRVLDGADRGRVFADMPTPLTIGREEGNPIQLNDERVSRFHVKIQEDQEQIVLTDLQSTNGTKVNGESVPIWVLRPGDVIALGRTLLVFGSRRQIAERLAALRGADLSDGITLGVDEFEEEPNAASRDFELNFGDDPAPRQCCTRWRRPDCPTRSAPARPPN